MSGAFLPGERALLVDRKGRRYALTLVEGGEFHTHRGRIAHDALIGSEEGSVVVGSGGSRYIAVRPTLAESVLAMPRGAQVVYPKDLGAIVMAADIRAGTRVLEAGAGSGALSMAMIASGAEVTAYEIREDFAARARHNVESVLGDGQPYRVEIRDVYEGIQEGEAFDRIVLDLPEPWRVLEHVHGALRPGGILISYLPSVSQVVELRRSLDATGFVMAETFEVLHRSWHVEGRSVRPDHRMVAHTGFITWARLLAVGEESRGPSAATGRRDQGRGQGRGQGEDQGRDQGRVR